MNWRWCCYRRSSSSAASDSLGVGRREWWGGLRQGLSGLGSGVGEMGAEWSPPTWLRWRIVGWREGRPSQGGLQGEGEEGQWAREEWEIPLGASPCFSLLAVKLEEVVTEGFVEAEGTSGNPPSWEVILWQLISCYKSVLTACPLMHPLFQVPVLLFSFWGGVSRKCKRSQVKAKVYVASI